MSEFRLKHNRIGILTSGGDCAGLNAAIRAVTYRALQEYGITVIGIYEGTAGLLCRPVKYEDLKLKIFTGNVLRLGGTILGTINTGDPFAYPMPDGSKQDRSDEVIEGIKALELDALIGIGGDGSMRILSKLANKGNIPFVGIPKTIDNDVAHTDFAIGYMSAVDAAVDALDRLQPTAASHRRVMVLEVMGRDVGWIAVAAAIAGGADIALIPEIPFDIGIVADKLRSIYTRGRNHALVVCAEGVKLASGETVSHAFSDGEIRYGGVGAAVGDMIAKATGAETRVTVLGHVQRGGTPNSFDRILASQLGAYAVDLVAEGKTDRVVVWEAGKIMDVPLDEVAGQTRELKLNGTLVQSARKMGICLGD
ncbi:MAG: ATP-dependent 6-phosphofructokinase [Hyphomicrobiales bacterium]|nr:ATP-dependent 6-phosphofructokinase [Hyphomicrobiales bacterium]